MAKNDPAPAPEVERPVISEGTRQDLLVYGEVSEPGTQRVVILDADGLPAYKAED